jgi:hypothetical protein
MHINYLWDLLVYLVGVRPLVTWRKLHLRLEVRKLVLDHRKILLFRNGFWWLLLGLFKLLDPSCPYLFDTEVQLARLRLIRRHSSTFLSTIFQYASSSLSSGRRVHQLSLFLSISTQLRNCWSSPLGLLLKLLLNLLIRFWKALDLISLLILKLLLLLPATDRWCWRVIFKQKCSVAVVNGDYVLFCVLVFWRLKDKVLFVLFGVREN